MNLSGAPPSGTERPGSARSWFCPPKAEKAGLCAYSTLSHTQIERETLSSALANKFPFYPVHVMSIAQLAEHNDAQGLGKVSLIRALRHCLEINAHPPSYAVVVDVLDEGVQGFYEQYGCHERFTAQPRALLR